LALEEAEVTAESASEFRRTQRNRVNQLQASLQESLGDASLEVPGNDVSQRLRAVLQVVADMNRRLQLQFVRSF